MGPSQSETPETWGAGCLLRVCPLVGADLGLHSSLEPQPSRVFQESGTYQAVHTKGKKGGFRGPAAKPFFWVRLTLVCPSDRYWSSIIVSQILYEAFFKKKNKTASSSSKIQIPLVFYIFFLSTLALLPLTCTHTAAYQNRRAIPQELQLRAGTGPPQPESGEDLQRYSGTA